MIRPTQPDSAVQSQDKPGSKHSRETKIIIINGLALKKRVIRKGMKERERERERVKEREKVGEKERERERENERERGSERERERVREKERNMKIFL